jgi:hypothetical protein
MMQGKLLAKQTASRRHTGVSILVITLTVEPEPQAKKQALKMARFDCDWDE